MKITPMQTNATIAYCQTPVPETPSATSATRRAGAATRIRGAVKQMKESYVSTAYAYHAVDLERDAAQVLHVEVIFNARTITARVVITDRSAAMGTNVTTSSHVIPGGALQTRIRAPLADSSMEPCAAQMGAGAVIFTVFQVATCASTVASQMNPAARANVRAAPSLATALPISAKHADLPHCPAAMGNA
jgi:hypothetical protein